MSPTATTGASIGAAVAINLPRLTNEAYVGAYATVAAAGLVVEAVMTKVGTGEDEESTSSFGASATSGASGGKVGVAGSLALNIVNAKSRAVIESHAQVTLAGDAADVRLTAVNTTAVTTEALPSTKGAEAAQWGIGASFALSIVSTTTVAELEADAVLTGAGSLTLEATADHSVATTATAGGAATGGSGYGIGGAVALTVVNHTTTAVVGRGAPLDLTGSLSASATHARHHHRPAAAPRAPRRRWASALGLNVVNASVLSTTLRELHVAGDVAFGAHASATSRAESIASAAGTEGETAAAGSDLHFDPGAPGRPPGRGPAPTASPWASATA